MRLLLSYDVGFTKEQLEKIAAFGCEIVTLQSEEYPGALDYSTFDIVICYRLFCYCDITKFSSLKLIHTTSAGLDHMPLDYIREHGITLFNAGGVFSAPMAEFALCGVLQLYKQAVWFGKNQRAHVWEQTRSLLELTGKRVCIVGSGSIGAENAKRFGAMGCHITGLCRHPGELEHFDEVRSINELDDILPESDIVILSVPLTDETRHLFDVERFEKMKKGSVLVNISRGPTVETGALIAALESGRLFGAVIDVCEQEPLPKDSPLWDMENVILTPHNSFYGEFDAQRMCALICKNFESYFNENK